MLQQLKKLKKYGMSYNYMHGRNYYRLFNSVVSTHCMRKAPTYQKLLLVMDLFSGTLRFRSNCYIAMMNEKSDGSESYPIFYVVRKFLQIILLTAQSIFFKIVHYTFLHK